MMPDKIILIAHRDPAVRERFAAALADARHAFVTAATAEAADIAARDTTRPLSLAVIDVSLGDNGVEWIRHMRGDRTWPVVVFAGTVRSVADARALLEIPVAGYVNEHAVTAHILPALAPYLFPASFDRRLSPRVLLSVPVSYRAEQTIATAVTMNLGQGGLAVRTLSPLGAGLLVELRFRPPGRSEINVRGRVVWSDRTVGMGIQFERVSAPDQRAIDALTGSR
jgi:uncharacterized protein (TIGR02266 family)